MTNEILFNDPYIIGNEGNLFTEFFENGHKFSGDGQYTKAVHQWFREYAPKSIPLLTTSCTHAMEIAALLMDIREGDEVIVPSFTFVSTANPFVLRGAKIVFVDVEPKTMNVDLKKVEEAITPKTKAIALVHYGGVACDMDKACEIAKEHNLFLLEDAAQCMDAYYQGKPLGTFGDFGAISFHDTKNIHCGEGGMLLINKEEYREKAEIIREKGTNRSKFLRGQIDKYSWVNLGSSYLPSELNAIFLLNQLNQLSEVTKRRKEIWHLYDRNLQILTENNQLELCSVMNDFEFNAHIYFIKTKDIDERQELIDHLKSHHIQTAFHYVPLHSAKAGREFGYFYGEDTYTTKESERLLRLPLHMHLSDEDVIQVCDQIKEFY